MNSTRVHRHRGTARFAQRRGITLLELLVVFGILVTLMAIAIPAIQFARDAMRRSQCQNNLKQISLATHAFHNSKKSLPSLFNGTSLEYPLSEADLFHTHSWRAELLPFGEQSALYDQVSLDSLATAPANDLVAQTVVPSYICPTSPEPSSNMAAARRHPEVAQPSDVPEYRVVISDYDAIAGIQVLPNPLPSDADIWAMQHMRWGAWGWPQFDNHEITNSRLVKYHVGKLTNITDGLSNTIAVVERGGKPVSILNGKPNVHSTNPNAIHPAQIGWSASNSVLWSVNWNDVGVNVSNATGIYSLHPSGANVSMADGSVQFLSEATDFQVLVELFSRSGKP